MSAMLPNVDLALYIAMRDAADVAAIVGTDIFNGLVSPARTNAFPRITIGNATDRDGTVSEGSTLGTRTGRVTEQIHLWSQVSRTELFEMYNAVYAALHHVNLPLVSGGQMIESTVEWIMDMPDPDGVTLHAVLRYSATARTTP